MNANVMDTNWILLGIDGALVIAVAVIWLLVSFMRHERTRLSEETAELRRSMETLKAEVGQLHTEAAQLRQAPSPSRTYTGPAVLSTDRRAEALEMLRQGKDAGTVSTTLRLSQAEANLLQKVQGMLSPAGYRR